MPEFRRILCGVDFSDVSKRALEHAVALAARLQGEILALHVYELPVYPLPDDVLIELPLEVETDLEPRLREQLQMFVKSVDTGAVPISTRLVQGTPYLEIVKVAKELPADLVVLGTHGHSGIMHLLLGSVAERVVRSSTVPVLTVRGEEG